MSFVRKIREEERERNGVKVVFLRRIRVVLCGL